MTFRPEQISYEPDWAKAPVPSQDAHWRKVDLGHGRKPGWLNAAASLPGPDEHWIADKLNRLERQAGAAALEAAMQERGGLEIKVPRPEAG
jgi:hypothetical protein